MSDAIATPPPKTASRTLNGNENFDEQDFIKTFDALHEMAMRDVSGKIRARAYELAHEPGYVNVTAVFFAHAEYISMGDFTRKFATIGSGRSWFADNFNGFIIITAFLTLAFGLIGIFGDKTTSAGFLEVAKIFAGAVVGGAAGAAVAGRKR